MANLLLIDNPGLVREQVRQAFLAPRHRVGVARTGSAGLGHVRDDPPDVVLLDARLPDQCGLAGRPAHCQARPVVLLDLGRRSGTGPGPAS